MLSQMVGNYKFALFFYIHIPNTYITTYLDIIVHNKKTRKSSKH